MHAHFMVPPPPAHVAADAMPSGLPDAGSIKPVKQSYNNLVYV